MQIFHKISAKKFFCRTLIFALVFLWQPNTGLADITETQPLDFGRWIITRNNVSDNITIQTDGSYSNSPQLIMLDPPQQGIYDVTGLPPFADIMSVDVVMIQTMQGGSPEVFTLDNFQVLAPDADGAGMTTLTLGARANTSGNSNGYDDSLYTGLLEITINL